MPLSELKPCFSENAVKVLEKRYLHKNDEGVVEETPSQLLWRVADFVAEAEEAWGNDPKTVAGNSTK